MKHFLQSIMVTFFVSTFLNAQIISHEYVQARIDEKRDHPHQNLPQNNAQRQYRENEFLFEHRLRADLPMPHVVPQIKKRKSNAFNVNSFSQTNIYVIDTAIVCSTTDTSRYLYTYNVIGKKLEYLDQRWYNNQWVNSYHATYSYDENGNMLTYIFEVLQNNQLLNMGRQTYTYDTRGNMLTVLGERWINNQWENTLRIFYLYDTKGNLLSEFWEDWVNSQWVNAARVTNTYDSVGNITTILHEYWSDNQWTKFYQYDFTYDANGNMLTEYFQDFTPRYNSEYLITYTYDANSNVLTIQYDSDGSPNERYTYTYNASNIKTSELYESWSDSLWIKFYRITYSYDTNAKLVLEMRDNWSNNQWTNAVRVIYTYDVNGNQLSYLEEYWINELWVNYERYMYKFIQNNLLTEVVHEAWQNSSWRPINKDFSLYNIAGISFSAYGYKINLSYKLIVTDVCKNDGMIATVYSLSQNYPNPFNPTTTIRYSLPSSANVKLSVYDLLGREIATLVNEEQSAGWKEVQWNAKNVSSGIYFYKLQAGSFVETRKMLLVR
ncbi:MAG: T9SS type A sorting domain-containing protein [Bacteroidota bacterium]